MNRAAKISTGVGGVVLTVASVLSVMTPFGPPDDYIRHFEGEMLEAYRDPVNIWTICSGTTRNVKPGDTATREICAAMRREDMSEAAEIVLRYVPPEALTLERAFALTSFVHNVGPGKKGVKDGFLALKKTGEPSTMLKKLRAGDIRGACNQLPLWNKAGGKELRGLTRRRAAEKELCLRGL